MNFIKRWGFKLALHILGGPHTLLDFDALEHKKIKVKPMKQWLFGSMLDDGWKNYYSYRNYELLEAAGRIKEHEEHLIVVGRLFELRSLRENMKLASERIKRDEKKDAEKKSREQNRRKIR